jgi:hypothetical protein
MQSQAHLSQIPGQIASSQVLIQRQLPGSLIGQLFRTPRRSRYSRCDFETWTNLIDERIRHTESKLIHCDLQFIFLQF